MAALEPEAASATVACAAALGAAGGWALGSLFFERLLRSHTELSAAAANFFKNSLALIVFAFILGGLPQLGAESWILFAVSGVFGFALGDALYFAALPRCGIQLTALCANLTPAIAVITAYLFLGEKLSTGILLAMVVIGTGIVLVLSDLPTEQQVDRSHRRSGLILALISAATQALAIVLGRGGFQNGATLLEGTVARLVGGVLAAVVFALVGAKLGKSKGPPKGSLIIGWTKPRLLRALLWPSFMTAVLLLPLHSAALQGAPGGLAAVLLTTTPLFTLPLARFSGHAVGKRTVFGTLLGLAGAAMAVSLA